MIFPDRLLKKQGLSESKFLQATNEKNVRVEAEGKPPLTS